MESSSVDLHSSTKNKLLLLDYVSEARSPIYFLAREDAGEVFNMPMYTCSLHNLQIFLFELLESQLIEVRINNLLTFYDLSKIELWLTGEEFFRHNKTKIPFYGLTEKGGSLWEECFSPKWDVFYKVEAREHNEYFYDNKYEISLEAGSIEYFKSLLACLRKEIRFLPYGELSMLEPWNPVYWKTLDKGHLARFLIKSEVFSTFDHSSIYRTLEAIKTPWRKPSITA